MELDILYGIGELHRPWLDKLMIFLTSLGDGGIFWIGLGLLLILLPTVCLAVPGTKLQGRREGLRRARSCGIVMLAAMALSLAVGNLAVKNLVARPRPFTRAPEVALLIPAPGEYSFPSGHTLHSFTAATVIFCFSRRAGIGACVLAALIAFSRLYLFVHYPTDILGGMILGVADGLLTVALFGKLREKRHVSPQ